MSKYIDGFVIPVPKGNVEKYQKIAQTAGEVWKKHGALDYYETVGDDLNHENLISFNTLAGASEDEAVIFAWIVFESKEKRDEINKAVMEDPQLKESMKDCEGIFDYTRMAYGGFKTLVEITQN